jgi:Protein of unknown function (DUF2628)
MRKYKVFEHPSGAVEAVKQGWSWPAFFFGAIWALTKRMWGLGLGVIAASVLLAFALDGAGSGWEAISDLAGLLVSLLFGAQGNAWRETKLISRGYEPTETVEARDSSTAIFQVAKGEAAA